MRDASTLVDDLHAKHRMDRRCSGKFASPLAIIATEITEVKEWLISNELTDVAPVYSFRSRIKPEENLAKHLFRPMHSEHHAGQDA